MFTFFKIRSKQLARLLLELGWWRLPLLLFLILFFTIGLFRILKEGDEGSAFVVVGLTWFSILTYHLRRMDGDFLDQLQLNSRLLMMGEYTLWVLPIAILLFLNGWAIPTVVLLGLCLLSSFLPQLQLDKFWAKGKTVQLGLIPPLLFEWKSGLRKTGWWVLIVWILGIVGYNYVITTPLTIILLSFAICSFYLEAESWAMITAHEWTPKQFLQKKVGQNLWLFLLLIAPHLLLFLVLHGTYWYFLLYILLGGITLQIFSIHYKYALFEPSIELRNNSFLIAFLGMGILHPLMLPIIPVLIFLTIRYYFRAKTNLQAYL